MTSSIRSPVTQHCPLSGPRRIMKRLTHCPDPVLKYILDAKQGVRAAANPIPFGCRPDFITEAPP